MQSTGRKAEMQVIGPFHCWDNNTTTEDSQDNHQQQQTAADIDCDDDANDASNDVQVKMIYLLSPLGEVPIMILD